MAKRLLLLPLIVIGAALLAACGGGAGEDLEVAPVLGSLAPDFELENLDGETVRLSDFRGQPVLINFWATWCGPCRVEMPDIQARHEKYAPDLVILAVDFDEPKETVQFFVDELELTFPILLDPGGKIQQLYLVRGYPSSYFVDREGLIQVVQIGVMTGNQLDEFLAEVGLE